MQKPVMVQTKGAKVIKEKLAEFVSMLEAKDTPKNTAKLQSVLMIITGLAQDESLEVTHDDFASLNSEVRKMMLLCWAALFLQQIQEKK